jgi:lactate racemase
MSNQRFKLTYGTGTIEFEIPKKRLSGPMISPRTAAPLEGTAAGILAAELSRPVGRPKLRELCANKRVGIVISDEFRAGLQREILLSLLEEAAAGKPKSIRVLCATGTHQPDVYAKNAGVWVQEASKQMNLPIDFEANDSEGSLFEEVGRSRHGTVVRVNRKLLECEVRVYGHESKHHYLNGYSCIDKQILPGMSCGNTVAQNHKLALDPGSGPGRNAWHPLPQRRANPFSEDTREARALSERFLLGPDGKQTASTVVTFGLEMVSEGKKIYWVRTGDPDMLCAEMVPVVDRLMAFEVERAKYVIVSPGGPPASQALYGTQNCFDLSLKEAILPGGEALVLAPLDGRPDLPPDVRGIAPDRRSKELFFDTLVRLLPLPLDQARQEIDRHFELYLWKTDRVLRLMKGDNVHLYVHSSLSNETLQKAGIKSVPDVQAWIDERAARKDGMFTVIDNGNKLCVTAKS